mmetsp:Transcript_25309/g.38976  ORF Transcript_25309/g.38976 Transcript_25309/m.38976 type:complete len:436 (-) Transcript_25309:34-1341(-)
MLLRGRLFTKQYLVTSLWASTWSTSTYYCCRAMSSPSTTNSGTSSPPASDPVRVSIAQLCSTGNKLNNLLDVAKCAGLAKREGSKMLFLPECFGFIGESSQQTLQEAEPPVSVGAGSFDIATSDKYSRDDDKQQEQLEQQQSVVNEKIISDALVLTISRAAEATGSTADKSDNEQINSNDKQRVHDIRDHGNISLLDGLKTIARESNLWLSAGGMHEGGAPPRDDDSNGQSRVYNSHVIIDNTGTVQCVYRKIHLFDVSIPDEGVHLRESATTAPGAKLVVCDSPIGRLGVTTCYDLRFPEMYTQLVREGGAQILLVPSAFTVPTGKAHWHTLLRARAIENQCYVLAAAQYGKHNQKRDSYGHALAVDPWGRILADAGGSDGPGSSPSEGALEDSDAVVATSPSIVSCNIDLNVMQSIQERMPVQQHREACKFSF